MNFQNYHQGDREGTMGKKKLFRLIIVSVASLAVILAAKELGENTSPKVLTDYPNSVWYSEQTGGYVIDI